MRTSGRHSGQAERAPESIGFSGFLPPFSPVKLLRPLPAGDAPRAVNAQFIDFSTFFQLFHNRPSRHIPAAIFRENAPHG
jgi:hypothetical protein